MKQPMFPITYRKANDNSWIQCFLCGNISRNFSDAVELHCQRCEVYHTNGIVEESSRLSPTPGDANREQKLIVALFLSLGKAFEHVPKNVNIEVSEAEIQAAWKAKQSPVSIVSRDEIWGSGNVFKVVPGNMKIKNVAPDLKGNLVQAPKKVRVFDFS
ncbi:hypothetical protein KGP36_02835 [Patescibacteria group bacterium]|nr:hypothetical protein [Patescibacteria group bacterium]